MTGEILDTEVVEQNEVVPYQPEHPSLFGTTDPAEVVVKATAVADALADVIQRKRLFVKVGNKHHVLVDGWQLLGSMLGITAVCVATEEIDGGYKATVEARTMDGRVVGRADAVCTKDERRGPWKSADDYARLSMAQTRATSKALKGPLGFVVSLAGYEATPAEEMTFAEQERPAEDKPDTISEATAKMLLASARASGVPTPKVTEWLAGHGGRVTALTPAQAEEFELWLTQQQADVPADVEGLVASS